MSMRMARDLIDPQEDCGMKIVHRADPIDTCYGIEVYRLSKEDIDELLNGKCLYNNNCEYATLIYFEELEDES